MNIGRFFSFMFILSGTIIFIAMSIIITMNFKKDARLYQERVATAVQDVETNAAAENQNKKIVVDTDSKKSDTAAKEKQPETKVENTNGVSVESEKKDEEVGESPVEKIKVEVVNFSGIKRVAEQIRSTLEASGYEVSAGNDKSSNFVRTEIIDKNGKNAGEAIQQLLKIGPVKKVPDPTSRFDVTIIIGDDYKP